MIVARVARVAIAVAVAGGIAGAALAYRAYRAEEREEEEERADDAPVFWRVRVVVEGEGRVRSTMVAGVDCGAACGPVALAGTARRPPLIVAEAAEGWVFRRWEASVHGAPRRIQEPTNPIYMDVFGDKERGEIETVRAVFERAE